jgi:hypothetical protein
MRWRQMILGLSIALGLGAGVRCQDVRCRELTVSPLDESRHCLRPEKPTTGLTACTPWPPTRGILWMCLADDSGNLYLTSLGDSERVTGPGWRYTGGLGTQALTPQEQERCTEALAEAEALKLDPCPP